MPSGSYPLATYNPLSLSSPLSQPPALRVFGSAVVFAGRGASMALHSRRHAGSSNRARGGRRADASLAWLMRRRAGKAGAFWAIDCPPDAAEGAGIAPSLPVSLTSEVSSSLNIAQHACEGSFKALTNWLPETKSSPAIVGNRIESNRIYLPHSNTIAVGALEGQSGLQRTKMAHQRAVMCSACEPRGSCFRL